jgi:hypothetical protein
MVIRLNRYIHKKYLGTQPSLFRDRFKISMARSCRISAGICACAFIHSSKCSKSQWRGTVEFPRVSVHVYVRMFIHAYMHNIMMFRISMRLIEIQRDQVQVSECTCIHTHTYTCIHVQTFTRLSLERSKHVESRIQRDQSLPHQMHLALSCIHTHIHTCIHGHTFIRLFLERSKHVKSRYLNMT